MNCKIAYEEIKQDDKYIYNFYLLRSGTGNNVLSKIITTDDWELVSYFFNKLNAVKIVAECSECGALLTEIDYVYKLYDNDLKKHLPICEDCPQYNETLIDLEEVQLLSQRLHKLGVTAREFEELCKDIEESLNIEDIKQSIGNMNYFRY